MMDGGFSHYERSASPPRRQRACHNCSKAKARCNFQDENIGKHCDRCHRLGTECMPQTTKSLRRPRQLKLTPRQNNSVFNLDHHNRSISPPELAPQWPDHFNLPASTISGAFPISPTPDYLYGPFDALYYPLPTPGIAHPSPTPQDIFTDVGTPSAYPAPPTWAQGQAPPRRKSSSPGHGLTWEQADQALLEYQTLQVPHFPFVVVENGISARQLSSDKPFLFRTIMLVSARVPSARRAAMKKAALAYLGHHLLVPEDRYLDLLQGLIVLVGRGDLDFYKDRCFTNLLTLMKDYAYNLGQAHISATKAPWLLDDRLEQEYGMGQGLDVQRAYLGCYYLMSAHSALFNRTFDFKKPGTKPNQCLLGDLDESTAASLDPNILHTVRIQDIVDKIITASANIQGDEEVSGAAAAQAYLASEEVRRCRARLDALAEGLDQTDPQFTYHWMHYNAALVRLYEPALLAPPSPSYVGGSNARAHCLSAAITAASSFFAAFLSASPEELVYRPFSIWAQLNSVVTAASHLLLVPSNGDDGWDAASARQTLDLSGVLAAAMNTLTAVSSLRAHPGECHKKGKDGERCRLLKFADRIKRIKDWYEMRLAVEDVSSMVMPVTIEQDFSQLEYDDEMLDSPQSQVWVTSMGDESWGTVY